jgi:hypothetical protein
MLSAAVKQSCISLETDIMQTSLPGTGFLRLRQIVGDPKRGIAPIIPVCPSTWWSGIKTGRYPRPVRIGPRTTAWRVEDIRALVEKMGANNVK